AGYEKGFHDRCNHLFSSIFRRLFRAFDDEGEGCGNRNSHRGRLGRNHWQCHRTCRRRRWYRGRSRPGRRSLDRRPDASAPKPRSSRATATVGTASRDPAAESRNPAAQGAATALAKFLKKASECFETLSMNGKSSMISNSSVRPFDGLRADSEPRRRTPTELF